MRRHIAEENDIQLDIPECPHQGPCPGTCPQCEKELRQLESALANRLSVGKVATVAGLALALASPAVAQTHDTLPPVLQQVTVQKPDKLFKVRGTVIDSKTKEPIPFVNVVFHSGETRVAVTQTDFDGLFKVELPAGDYKMEIRSVGYYTFEQQVSIAKKTDLGEILIECTAALLEGIVIIESSSTPLLEIDPYGNSQHLEIDGIQVNVK